MGHRNQQRSKQSKSDVLVEFYIETKSIPTFFPVLCFIAMEDFSELVVNFVTSILDLGFIIIAFILSGYYLVVIYRASHQIHKYQG